MKRVRALAELGPTLGPLGRRVKIFGALVSFVVGVRILVRPQPYWVAISAAYAVIFCITVAPLVAHDYFRLRNPHGSPPDRIRINIAAPLSCLSAVLLLRAVLDMDTVDLVNALCFGLLPGLAYALFLWVIVQGASFGIAAVVGLLLGPAVLLHTNAATLSEESYRERGIIVRKYKTTKPPRLVVVASLAAREVELTVGREAFASYSVGQDVCTDVRSGAFGIRVRFIRAC